jgi:hypothetical protein
LTPARCDSRCGDRRTATRRLGHLAYTRALGQHPSKLIARGDVELAEDLAQVVGDRVLADEQPRADLGVRETVTGEAQSVPAARVVSVIRSSALPAS